MSSDFTIYDAKLKVLGDIQVAGSIINSTSISGYGQVNAYINNTELTITSGYVSGSFNFEYNLNVDITSINHIGISNDTTIYISLKNSATDTNKFISFDNFSSDNTIRVNYDDKYYISPGESGLFTIRKVNNILLFFVQDMFTNDSTLTTKPFYIKDGTNYKFPLYLNYDPNLTFITIHGHTLYHRSGSLVISEYIPKGLSEYKLNYIGSVDFVIRSDDDFTTFNYEIYNIQNSSNAQYGSIYRGSIEKVRFGIDPIFNEAFGTFYDTNVSSGESYTLYLNETSVVSNVFNAAITPKVTEISIDLTTITFYSDIVVPIIKYTINDDPEQTTTGTTVNHNISSYSFTYIKVVARICDNSSNQLSARRTFYGYVPPTPTEYPPFALTANSSGGYIVSASTSNYETSFMPYKAFDKVTVGNIVGWHSAESFTLANSDHNNTQSLGGISGEWLKLKLPSAILLTSVNVVARSNLDSQGPDVWYILGSNNDIDWYQVHASTTVVFNNSGSGVTDTITSSSSYSYYAIVVSSTRNTACVISEIKYFGY